MKEYRQRQPNPLQDIVNMTNVNPTRLQLVIKVAMHETNHTYEEVVTKIRKELIRDTKFRHEFKSLIETKNT